MLPILPISDFISIVFKKHLEVNKLKYIYDRYQGIYVFLYIHTHIYMR